MAEKVVMGYVKCPVSGCSEFASVMKTAGTRTQFYTRCPECGCDQRNGQRQQNWIKDNMQPKKELLQATEPVAPVVEQKEPEPASGPDPVRPPRPVENKPKTTKTAKVGIFAVFGLVFGGLCGLAI